MQDRIMEAAAFATAAVLVIGALTLIMVGGAWVLLTNMPG